MHKHWQDEYSAACHLDITEIREHLLKFTRNQLSLLKKKKKSNSWRGGCDLLEPSRRCSTRGFKKELDKFRHCRSKNDIKETDQGCTFNIIVK